jgi:hypothetical protein
MTATLPGQDEEATAGSELLDEAVDLLSRHRKYKCMSPV